MSAVLPEPAALSFCTLKYGGTGFAQNETLLANFMSRKTVGILYAGRETTEHYARLFVQLKRAGTAVPDNDLWIAALALEYDLALLARDRHFDKVPQLRRALTQ